MEADVELARKLAEMTTPRVKACWRNSIDALCAFRLTQMGDGEEVCYVEGWTLVLGGTIPIEHGWLEIGGKVVDVTLPGEIAGDLYFPVIRYDFDEVGREVSRWGQLPFFDNHKEGRKAMSVAWLQLPCNADVVRAIRGSLDAVTSGIFIGTTGA